MSGTDEFGLLIACGFPELDAPGITEVDLLMVHFSGVYLACYETTKGAWQPVFGDGGLGAV